MLRIITLIPAFLIKNRGFVWKSDVFYFRSKRIYLGKQLNKGKINVTKLESPKTHCSEYMESNPNFQSLKLSMTLIY